MNTGSQAEWSAQARKPLRQPGLPRVHFGIILGILGLLAAVARLPLIRTPVDISPDGCEYLGIARHLASERRWVSSLKWNFFTDAPVTHPALADRPPLFPVWAAAWMTLSSDVRTQIRWVRVSNLLLAALLPPLLFWSLRGAVKEVAAALTALIFLLYPAFLRISAQPLTEPLFLVLFFGSLGIFLRAHSDRGWFSAGLLVGLAFLTRPEGLLLPPLYGAALLARSNGLAVSNEKRLDHSLFAPRRTRGWRPLWLILMGFALPLLPYWLGVAAQTGSPFTSVLRYNYSIRHIDEGTFYGFERTFAPPLVFVRTHTAEVARLVAQQWITMGRALGGSLVFVLPLALFWRGRTFGWGQATLSGLAALNFVFHAMSWTVWGAARYMFPTYILCMAILFDGPLRWAARDETEAEKGEPGCHPPSSRRRPLSISRLLASGALTLAVGLALAACLKQDARLYREKARPYGGVHLGWAYAEAASLLAKTPGVCAANQPWIVNLLADRPAVMAPRFRDVPQLRRYLARYRPANLTLFVTERQPGDVATAHRLVRDLWTYPRVQPELESTLELTVADLRTARPPRQALLAFRVRDGGR